MFLKAGTYLALISGTLAALVSIFAKLAFHERIQEVISSYFEATLKTGFVFGESATFTARLLLVALLVVANCMMWVVFSKALALSSSSAEVTVVNAATNFLVSAIGGAILFGESFTLMWYVGVTLILVGLGVILQGQTMQEQEHKVD